MKNVSTLPISDIQIGERHRKDLGDIEGLAHSIAGDGLLQPIGVTPDNRLVFGYRRLIACRDHLGWTEIPTVVIDIENLTHGEWVENTIRKDLTLSEMVAITDALRSFSRGGDRRSDQYRNNPNGTTKKEACEIVGWKMDKYDDAKKVVEKAIDELVQSMDQKDVSPHAAAQLADESEEIQREAVKKLGAAKTAAEKRRILKTVRRIKRNKEIAKRREEELKVPSEAASVRIFQCPFQDLQDVADLQPESVRCVLTDFPYDNKFMDQISELARFSKDILVPGGLLVAYTGQHRLTEKLRRIEEHLTFRWLGTSRWHQKANEFMPYKLVSKSSPFLIYSKGDWTPLRKWSDTLEIEGCEKNDHPYQKPIEEIERLLQYFSQPGDLVVDPCGGSFTTAVACQRLGRRCVSCDIEKAYVVRGLERLAEDGVVIRGQNECLDGTAPIDLPYSPDDLAA